MKRTLGMVLFLVGLGVTGWAGFNYWKEQGDFPTMFVVPGLAVFLLGVILLMTGRKSAETMER